MANAPAHSKNSATSKVTIFHKNGDALVATRLNAIDLVRGGEYFWKADDANHDRPESSGPADPTSDTVVVYDGEGTQYEVSQANARDMVNTAGYFWNSPTGTSEEEALDAVIEAANAAADAESVVAQVVNPEINPDTETLLAQAERVSGSDDIVSYLEGFSEQNLRDMAVKRYDEKIHHRASKATIIVRIVELEEEKQLANDQ